MLKSEVSTLDLLEDLHSRKNRRNSASYSFSLPWANFFTQNSNCSSLCSLCLLVSFSIEGRISTEQSKPVTDASGQEKPRLNHLFHLHGCIKRDFNWALKDDPLLVVSIVSYHSQIKRTHHDMAASGSFTNPLSSSHDDSATPNITRVIVVTLQHLTSGWKTSQLLKS